jgi:hypothetical protein
MTSYFGGTWACRSTTGTHGVRVYGLIEDGNQLGMVNPFVTPGLQFGRSAETYAQGDHGITLTENSGSSTFAASSAGWNGDTLTFLGTVVNGTLTTQRRDTYRRSDLENFTVTYEQAATADGPWTTSAEVTCRRVDVTTTAPTPAPVPAVTIAAGEANPTGLQRLAEQLAGPPPAQIYVAALPAGHTVDPQPDGATLIGSVQRANTTQVYYELGNSTSTVADYVTKLKTLGWRSGPPAGLGGFAALAGDYAVLCRADDKASVSLTSESGTTRRFRATFTDGNPACTDQPTGFFDGWRGPLPTFAPPDGVAMTGDVVPIRMGSTGATIVTKVQLASVMSSFEAQMEAAKWKRLDRIVGARTATESFTITDKRGTPWESTITIYAAPGNTYKYYCLIDTTNLKDEGHAEAIFR